MLQKDIRKGLKKVGIKMQELSMSGRVKGWCNSTTTGWDFSSVYPWYTTYVRKGYRLKSYLSDRSQEVTLTFSKGFTMNGSRDVEQSIVDEQVLLVKNTLDILGVQYKQNGLEFIFNVDNPYSEQEVERSQEKWNRITSMKY